MTLDAKLACLLPAKDSARDLPGIVAVESNERPVSARALRIRLRLPRRYPSSAKPHQVGAAQHDADGDPTRTF